MSISLSVFKSQVDEILQASTEELTAAARYEFIKAAVERYSKDNPDTRTEDVTGDAGRYYVLSTILDYWSEGFSRIDQIQYPAPDVASDEVPIYLEPEDWTEEYWAELAGVQTRYLYLPNHTPAATETMRITYTVPWLWSAGSSTTAVNQVGHGLSVDDYAYLSGSDWVATEDVHKATHQVTAVADDDNCTVAGLVTDVPQQDFFAICNLAACLCCRGIAVRYASSTDSTINADSTAHTTRSQEFSSRAKDLCDMYMSHMGLGVSEGQTTPMSEFIHWDTTPEWPRGRRYVYHERGR
jgi:hypothetical protein